MKTLLRSVFRRWWLGLKIGIFAYLLLIPLGIAGHLDDIYSRVPLHERPNVPVWLIVVELIALLVTPLWTFFMFSSCLRNQDPESLSARLVSDVVDEANINEVSSTTPLRPGS